MVERGTKRKCASCGISYYDLNRHPITCPKCGAPYEAAIPTRPPRGRLPATPAPRDIEIEEPVEEAEAEGGDEEFEETDDLPSDDESFVAPDEDEDRE